MNNQIYQQAEKISKSIEFYKSLIETTERLFGDKKQEEFTIEKFTIKSALFASGIVIPEKSKNEIIAKIREFVENQIKELEQELAEL